MAISLDPNLCSLQVWCFVSADSFEPPMADWFILPAANYFVPPAAEYEEEQRYGELNVQFLDKRQILFFSLNRSSKLRRVRLHYDLWPFPQPKFFFAQVFL